MNKSVLVVDDSIMVRHQVRAALDPAGFDVIEAVDGADGLAKLAANSDICLILCDVNMPVMDGIEMITVVQNERRSAAAVVMLTTEGSPELIRQARQCGAKGWIVKPFNPAMLVGVVRKLAA